MHVLSAAVLALSLAQAHTPATGSGQKPPPKTKRAAVHAQKTPPVAPSQAAAEQNALALQQQVMLDRAGFSPGVIDGRPGANTRKALAMFEQQGAAVPSPAPVEPLTRYRITADDAAGPFIDMPDDMMEKAKLPALGYTSLIEALA